jgi:hypothetical protein
MLKVESRPSLVPTKATSGSINATVRARHSTTSSEETSWRTIGSIAARLRITPRSTSSPPLRYSGSAVSPSNLSDAEPRRFQRLEQRIGQPLGELVERDDAVGGVLRAHGGMPAGIADGKSIDREPGWPDRRQALQQCRKHERC